MSLSRKGIYQPMFAPRKINWVCGIVSQGEWLSRSLSAFQSELIGKAPVQQQTVGCQRKGRVNQNAAWGDLSCSKCQQHRRGPTVSLPSWPTFPPPFPFLFYSICLFLKNRWLLSCREFPQHSSCFTPLGEILISVLLFP